MCYARPTVSAAGVAAWSGGAVATAVPGSVTRRNFQTKHAMWVVFGLMTLYVLATRDRTLLDSHSFLRVQVDRQLPALRLHAFQFVEGAEQTHLDGGVLLGIGEGGSVGFAPSGDERVRKKNTDRVGQLAVGGDVEDVL